MKNAVVGIVVAVGIVTSVCVSWLYTVFPPMPSFNAMQAFYRKNSEDLNQIARMLKKLEFNTAQICDTDEDYHYVQVYDTLSVKPYAYHDDEAYAALNRLLKGRLRVFIKDDNYMQFQFWGTLDDSCGLVYSMDGNLPKMVPNDMRHRVKLTLLPLEDESDWYYYVWDWQNR